MALTKHDLKRTINQVIREKNRFPTLQEMADILDFSPEQTRKYMQALAEDGYLEQQGEWYKFAEEKIEAIETINEIMQETAQEAPTEVLKKKAGRPIGSKNKKPVALKQPVESESEIIVSLSIVKYVMAIIGTGACLLSIYYTWLWLNETLPWFFALILSSIMVLFSVFSFEVIIIFLSGQVVKNRFYQFGVSFVFSLLWLAVVTFSMITSIAGQVNEHFKNNIAHTLSMDNSENQEWKILQEQKKDIKERISEYKSQLSSLNSINKGINTIEERKKNKGVFYDTQYRIRKSQNEINKLMNELDKVRDREKELAQTKKIVSVDNNKPDFYKWLSETIGMKTDNLQLFMSLLIASFIDIIAPFALAVALFLKNKSE